MGTTAADRNSGILTNRQKLFLALSAMAGLFGAPGAWLLQVMVSETLAAQACDGPTRGARFGALHADAWVIAISIGAISVAVLCAAFAICGFVVLGRRQNQLKTSRADSSAAAAELRRKRFIALCSMEIGCGFVVGLAFTTLVRFFLDSCSAWH